MSRPKSRKIDDSKRPAAERGLPKDEIRHMAVYNKKQLQKVKDLVVELAKDTTLKKVGSVPPIQLKNLISEALSDLFKKYDQNKPQRAYAKKLKIYLAKINLK